MTPRARPYRVYVPSSRRAARRAARFLASTALLCLLLVPATARAEDFSTKVVGGTIAEPGEFPWQIALIKVQGQTGYFTCGGTLIADRRVVTAAHCTSGSASSLRVRVGSQRFDSGGSIIAVSSYVDHPSYSSQTNRFDVAVLQLAASGIAAGGQPLQLIGAQGSTDDTLWAPGKMLSISGWGTTSESGSVSTQLRKARVPRVADSTCGQSDWYGSAFDPATMVCAGFEEGGVDTCQGDSGGPLAASTLDPPPSSETNPSQWRLVGATSWGIGCARPKKPGVYARIAAPDIRNWILGTSSLRTLTVNVSGSGTVTSSPGTISCPPDCSYAYADGTNVTLTAMPTGAASFVSWGGACSGTSTTCIVTMNQAKNVTAQFTSTTFPLNVTKQGTGAGTVTSSPAGIDCGTTCTHSFSASTSVNLTATAASGSAFAGWDGEGCSGTGTCTVTMNQARNVTATFGVQLQDSPVPTDPSPTDPSPTDPSPTDPSPTDPSPTDPSPTAEGRALPAKLEVRRAQVRSVAGAAQRGAARRRLVVRGSLDPAAAGERVVAKFRAAGRQIVIRPVVQENGQFAVNSRLRGPQRRARAGQLRLRYRGNETLRAVAERLRAARRAVRLRITRVELRGNRLAVAGTVRSRARSQARILIEFNRPNGDPAQVATRARVNLRGRFRTRLQVPAAVRTLGAWVSITHRGRARLFGQRRGRNVGE